MGLKKCFVWISWYGYGRMINWISWYGYGYVCVRHFGEWHVVAIIKCQNANFCLVDGTVNCYQLKSVETCVQDWLFSCIVHSFDGRSLSHDVIELCGN